MMLRTRVLLGTTATLALLTAGAAHAQAINGGGSTLASPTYEALFFNFENNDPAADFSSYAPSGSGAAITAVLTNTPNVTGGPVPFDFGASDATITDAQLQTWNTGTTGRSSAGLLIQIPSIGTPITVPFNFSGIASNTAINLSDAQLCGIYSGKITSTSDAALSGSGIPSSNATLHVVYRSDNSGTTFLFTQHLAAVCTSSTSNITFFATQTFSNLFTTAGKTVPATFATGNGSPGVQSTIGSTPNSVGYLSPDYTREIASPTGGAAAPYVAEVNGVQPTPTNTQTALATGTPSTDPSVNPAGTKFNPADPVSFVPVAANPGPGNGYPIVGYTTFVLPECFADASVAATLKTLITDLYRNAGYGSAIRANGFTPIASGVASTVISDYLLTGGTAASTINGVGAGHPGLCASVAGR